jgi:hypothetical protein
MKLNYSKKILIMSIILFIGVIVLDVIFTNLLLAKIRSINDKVKQLDISSQERLRELNLKEAISSSLINREKLSKYFVGPGNSETVDFTKYLENLALENNVVQKKTLNYEPAIGLASSSVTSVIRYKFETSGGWNNSFNFLRGIENLPKVSYLNSLLINLNPDGVSEGGAKSSGKTWSTSIDFSVIKLKN